jgi:hypothetical protein
VHEHHNGDPNSRALLFSVHDAPLLKALDKFRTLAHTQAHQEIVDEFVQVVTA